MLDSDQLIAQLPHRFDGADLAFLGPKYQGKVRDNYTLADGQRVLVVTDRLSAFDRILGRVPFKGQVLNQLAAWWFEHTRDIVPNHLLAVPDPNVTVAQECQTLPIEVVVRGYITGVTSTALWYRYAQGERQIYGLRFPDGLEKNDELPEPILTPTTKAADGGHDQRITEREIVERRIVQPQLWEQVRESALALFRRGQALAERGGLMLVDTKYEFGLSPDGALTLIDEVHTPDSSRFWLADSFEERRAAGSEPENYDKEFVRLRYAATGYIGDGPPAPLSDELAVAAAERYIACFERISGHDFAPAAQPTAPRVEAAMKQWSMGNDGPGFQR